MTQEPPDQDWVAQAVGSLEGVVDAIRSRTTEPLLNLVKTLVFGMLAAGMVVMALLLLTIGSVRALDAYLPQGVWLAYFLVGAVLTLFGLFLWRKRHKPQP